MTREAVQLVDEFERTGELNLVVAATVIRNLVAELAAQELRIDTAVQSFDVLRDQATRTAAASIVLQGKLTEMEAGKVKLWLVLNESVHTLEGSRIWGGMEWTYNPIHPVKYLPALEKMRVALRGSK